MVRGAGLLSGDRRGAANSGRRSFFHPFRVGGDRLLHHPGCPQSRRRKEAVHQPRAGKQVHPQLKARWSTAEYVGNNPSIFLLHVGSNFTAKFKTSPLLSQSAYTRKPSPAFLYVILSFDLCIPLYAISISSTAQILLTIHLWKQLFFKASRRGRILYSGSSPLSGLLSATVQETQDLLKTIQSNCIFHNVAWCPWSKSTLMRGL